jgi:hypothetical protein
MQASGPSPASLEIAKPRLAAGVRAFIVRSAIAGNLDLSAILNAAETPEQHEFDRIGAKDGWKAALRWRDSRYGELGDKGQ